MPGARTIYLIRHAIAHERGERWPDDDLRPLTDEGMEKMRRVAKGLVAAGAEIDLILSSPLVRAQQTAEIVAGAFNPAKVVPAPSLAPGEGEDAVATAIASQKVRQLALVGHEPDLGHLAAWLLGATRPLPFKKGGVARFEVPDRPKRGSGQLVWFAPPRMLKKIRST